MSARDVIACSLDHPSVFMGGPSERNQREAGAILSALSAAGWVVVPREPTEAMQKAAPRAVWGDCWNELDDDAQAEAMADCAATYRAMLAAVLPAAPQEATDDGR